MDDNAIRSIFVGYSNQSPGYELYDLEQGVFFTASSVEFVEEGFPGKEMISELEDLLVHEEDEWSHSDKEEDFIDDDESDVEEEDLKRKKNKSSEMNDDVGDDVLTDLETKESEGNFDIESENKEEEYEAEKDHGSGEDGTESEANRYSGLKLSE